MSKLEDDQYLRRTRATWLAEKLDINYASANAILSDYRMASATEGRKITEAINKDTRAPLHKRFVK